MHMSWEEFRRYASQFIEVSNKLNDGWTCMEYEDIPGGLYVTKKVTTSNSASSDKDVFNNRKSCIDEMTVDDDDSGFKDLYSFSKVESVLTWEYHIVYSVSYAVPVLYFNVWNSGGKLISIEEIWNAYPPALPEKWQFITQQEHPILRKPCYQFHPCKTSQLMENFKESRQFAELLIQIIIFSSFLVVLMIYHYYPHPFQAQKVFSTNRNRLNPLVTWLSTISQFVHLQLLLDYGKLCIRHDNVEEGNGK